jgi:hypothetical protein
MGAHAVARGPGRGAGGDEEGEPQWLGGAPFVIPDVETPDVQLKGLPTKVEREPFHQQLVTLEDHAACVARLAVAWATPDSFDAVVRQATVLDLVPDETLQRFLIHPWPRGVAASANTPHFTGVSTP